MKRELTNWICEQLDQFTNVIGEVINLCSRSLGTISSIMDTSTVNVEQSWNLDASSSS